MISPFNNGTTAVVIVLANNNNNNYNNIIITTTTAVIALPFIECLLTSAFCYIIFTLLRVNTVNS